jgi:glycosidase
MPLYPFTPAVQARLQQRLTFLYGEQQALQTLHRVQTILGTYESEVDKRDGKRLTEKDIVLITYPDQLRAPGESPLKTLGQFLTEYLEDLITTVHLLPFYPYSSDDGFSVIDYRQVNPDFGDWNDIEWMGNHFKLMFDAVINHISSKSDWMKHFMEGDPAYRDFFIQVDPNADLSSVVRPRDLPLLTRFQKNHGEIRLWTTFSADQIDLNYANPQVLLEIIDLLLYYIRRGASIIRLDAIAFLWKEIGTTCIHLPQTHQIVKLMRDILDEIAPHVLLLTETNVPHQENLSYFGDGQDEAHMVYQFALPPLILHTITTGDATHLTEWAAMLERPSQDVTFFNFTASHDGIGVRPARGILSESEIDRLISLTESRGGGVSYRRLEVHGRQAYELNINYFNVMNDPSEIADQPERAVARFLCSQAIMLTFPGLPAIYFHSLFGSRNDPKGVERTGHLRSINREKYLREPFEDELMQGESIRHQVFHGYKKLLQVRRSHDAFDPWGEHDVLRVQPGIFCNLRQSPDDRRRILCLHEVSGKGQMLNLRLKRPPSGPTQDLLNAETIDLTNIQMRPYQVRWIQLD